jgi:O-antigen/teichoic acid export membrane protein
MIDKIFKLGKETVIYGLSTVLGRLLNFLIVPLYANVLTPAENGIISNIYAYIAFAFIIFCYGMEPAYMRFVSSLENGDKKQNFSIPFISLFITSLTFALAINFSSVQLASLIDIGIDQHQFIRYAGWILCFDTLTIIPFASLRMEHKAKRFASLKLLNILSNLLFNLILILGFGMHAEGVLLANLLASIITFVGVFNLVLKHLTLQLSLNHYWQILKFGLPYIPAGLAGIAMQVIDRPIVKALTDDATLGIYQINHRLGIFMMLIVGMFDYAWRPFFLNHAKDPDAKPLFSKVFTYFSLAAMSIFIFVSLFIEDLVRVKLFDKYFIPPLYWYGLEIVPFILLAYIFTGAYVVFVVGVYLEKKTKYLPLISGTGALLNVGANFILIPVFGILGAAFSMLSSYLVMAVGMYITSQKCYKIEYEWAKVLKIGGTGIGIFILYRLIHPVPLEFIGIMEKIILIVAFGFALLLIKVIERKEIIAFKSLILKLAQRKNDTTVSEVSA